MVNAVMFPLTIPKIARTFHLFPFLNTHILIALLTRSLSVATIGGDTRSSRLTESGHPLIGRVFA